MSSLVVGGGSPDLLLVAVVALGLLRGSSTGAVLGFVGGLLVDVLTLGTLGVTSLVLTLAGFWAGRYGETTGRDRRFAPVLAVAAITVAAAAFGYVLHYLLGEEVVARHHPRDDARAGARRERDPRTARPPTRSRGRG